MDEPPLQTNTDPSFSDPIEVFSVDTAVKIGLVGPCAAGKSTLAGRLIALGYTNVRHIAQEHSYVPDMWQRLTHPDVLIFLDVSYPLTLVRRRMDWNEGEYAEQLHRLRHARQHAGLYIQTDRLTPDQVLEQVLAFLKANSSDLQAH